MSTAASFPAIYSTPASTVLFALTFEGIGGVGLNVATAAGYS
jgi:hypothetical protein